MKRLLLTVSLFSMSFMLGSAGAADKSLILYLPLDDGVGTVAKDASPYENDGAVLGNAGWVPGKIGGALEFNGTGDLVDLGAFDVVGPGITLAGWLKPNGFGINDAIKPKSLAISPAAMRKKTY